MERHARQVRSHIALKLFAATLVGLLTLVVVEAGSYLFGVFEGPLRPLRVGHIQIYGRHDPLLFWSLRPGATSPDGERWINSDGLRGPEIGPKQPGEFRILSLGESTTFAAQLRYEDCYSAVLERRLNAAPRAGFVRVLNAGVPGYTLFQGVQFLRHRAPAFEPDMVLLYFGYNDFLPVAFVAERAGEDTGGLNDRELFQRRGTPRRRLAEFLIAHSNLYRGLLSLRAPGGAAPVTNPEKPRVPEADRRWLLDTALEICEARGIQLVTVVPIYLEFERHAGLLRAFARSTGTPLVDLPLLLSERLDGDRESYFLDPIHPNSEGHRLIAEVLQESLAPLLP